MASNSVNGDVDPINSVLTVTIGAVLFQINGIEFVDTKS